MSHANDEGPAPRPLRDKRGLVNRVHRLRGQVQAEAAFHARATKTHMVAPVSKHWR